MVLDDETIEWLLNTFPRSSAAKQWTARTGSNGEEDAIISSAWWLQTSSKFNWEKVNKSIRKHGMYLNI